MLSIVRNYCICFTGAVSTAEKSLRLAASLPQQSYPQWRVFSFITVYLLPSSLLETYLYDLRHLPHPSVCILPLRTAANLAAHLRTTAAERNSF